MATDAGNVPQLRAIITSHTVCSMHVQDDVLHTAHRCNDFDLGFIWSKAQPGGVEGAQAPPCDQNIDVCFLSFSPTLYCKSRSGALQNVLWQYHRRSNTFVIKPSGYEFSRFEKDWSSFLHSCVFCATIYNKSWVLPCSASVETSMTFQLPTVYGAPFVKILYLTDLAQKLLSLCIYSYLWFFVSFIAPRICRVEPCTSAELPDVPKQTESCAATPGNSSEIDWTVGPQFAIQNNSTCSTGIKHQARNNGGHFLTVG